jgi:sec-independent protein translocase protein TatC
MKLRPIGQDDRLSIIDHLDELRTRVIICVAGLLIAFCVCFWQNTSLLSVLNRALPDSAKNGLGDQRVVNNDIGDTFKTLSVDILALRPYLAQGATPALQKISTDLRRAGKRIPQDLTQKERPLAIGVGEGFTITIAVCAYFALLITLPLILYQAYAFVIPALSKEERGVLPPAVHFLQGYNNTQFQVLVGANSYYKFEIMLMMGIGLAFEVPLFALGLQRVGAISASTLTLNWRYALVLIAVIVAALPGVDPVTMTMETLPLVAIYALSIVLLKWVEHRNYRRSLVEAVQGAGGNDPSGAS